ncbi:tRNA lysidine(34) synthetase TilS [filamentous cyanobacterium CCP5]|nr:tRNA lysidine(34) synthetase TilS [filamentous cyanobacterium CCP5]
MPWSDLHARVHQGLRQSQAIPSGSSLLVAVSGGQDSLCLLKLLVDLRSKWRWQLEAIHCDHRWRDDSAANAAHVQHLCEQWQVPSQVVRAETPPESEAAARQWRYQVFAAQAIATQATHVITGHTASDRAETLLYNLMRGSGADGLQALVEQRPLTVANPIGLVRPLLGTARQETAEFCQAFELPVWEDATNGDRTYARNRIRLDLMPYLAAHFNPRVETALAQTAELLTAEVDYLEQEAASLYSEAVEWLETGVRIQRRQLASAHLAIQRRVLRRVLLAAIAEEVSFDHVEKLVALLSAPNRSQSDPFPGGAIARVDQDWILLGATPWE